MDYEILEDITSADIALRIKAPSLNELFIKGANALMSEMVDDIYSIKNITSRKGVLKGTDISILYFEFLNEIIFFRDAESLLLLPTEVKISGTDGLNSCSYILAGEKINKSKHKFKVEVKAVTLHNLQVYENEGMFIAETVLDI